MTQPKTTKQASTKQPAAAQPLVEPYLSFAGRCEEAMGFYRDALGAELEFLMRFDEAPEAPPPGMVPEGWGRKVMHASLRIGACRVMASDGCGGAPSFTGFSLSLTLPTVAELDRAFAALSAGGQVTMPLGKTFWSARFGMLTDRFGVGWMLTVPVSPA